MSNVKSSTLDTSLLISSYSKNSIIKTICPIGAPTICYFSEGKNKKFITKSDISKVIVEFQRKEYDAIIVDSIAGFRAIKQYKSPYAFAQLLTKNNLYLVSNKKNYPPKKVDSIMAFPCSKNGIPHLVLIKYLKKCHISDLSINNIYWVDDISSIRKQMNINLNKYDYYLLAEPLFSVMKDKYKWYCNLSEELGFSIPQASLFINKNKYRMQKSEFVQYLMALRSRMEISVIKYSNVKKELENYGDNQALIKRFGFTNQIAELVQSHNGFGVQNIKEKYGKKEINAFLSNMQLDENYDDTFFIDM